MERLEEGNEEGKTVENEKGVAGVIVEK